MSKPTDPEEHLGPMYDHVLARRMLPYLRPHRARIGWAVLILLVTSGVSLVGPILIKRAFDVDIAGRNWHGLVLTVGAFLAVQIVSMALHIVQTLWVEGMGQAILFTLKSELFAHILDLPQSWHDRHPTGRLLSRVESDTEAMRQLFTQSVVMLLANVIMLVGMLAVMLAYSWQLTLVILVLLPVVVGVAMQFRQRIFPMFLESRKRRAEITGFLTEHIQGLPVVQAFNQQGPTCARLDGLNRAKFDIDWRAGKLVVLFWNGIGAGQALTIGLVFLAGVVAMQLGDATITVGLLIMFYSYIQMFWQPIRALSDQLAVMQRAFASMDRLAAILDTPSEHAGDPPDPPPFDGVTEAIEVEGVWFAYRHNGAEEPDWVLEDIGFRLPVGERWALVGATGGGKSTIVKLLFGFHTPQRGTIRFDGRPIDVIGRRPLRRRIGMVLQDIYIFPGTVLDNIRLWDASIDEGRVEAVARTVFLHDHVMRWPDGYHTELSERGENLSMGERQLLSFARALVFEPDVLVLDEATASVDPETEHEVQTALERALTGRTALIIAHRLSTIRSCDRILVVEDGRVVESGSHDELMAEAGRYAGMHELQQERMVGAPRQDLPGGER